QTRSCKRSVSPCRKDSGLRNRLADVIVRLALLAVLSALAPQPLSADSPRELQNARSDVPATYAALPFTFIENAGHVDPAVRFYARGRDYSVYFTTEELVIGVRQGRLSTPNVANTHEQSKSDVSLALKFLDADRTAVPEGQRERPGKVHYLIGNDPHKW